MGYVIIRDKRKVIPENEQWFAGGAGAIDFGACRYNSRESRGGGDSLPIIRNTTSERRNIMKIHNVKDAKAFLATVDSCKGDVWLESTEGDKINLKSALSQYIAIAALVTNRGDDLGLFCSDPTDEPKFYELFNEHKSIEP